MSDTAEEFLASARATLLGRAITDRQLAGNSVSLWIKDENGGDWTIWCEPSWQLAEATKVLAASRQAQDEEDGGFGEVSAALDQLIGRDILGLAISEVGELTVRMAPDLELRTFVSDPRDPDLWFIKDRSRLLGVQGGPQGLSLIHSKR